MPVVNLSGSTPVASTARVKQLEGLFDVAPSARSEWTWSVNLPLDDKPWQIRLVVGPSGSGRSTLAREAWGGSLVAGYDWPADMAVVDGFPRGAIDQGHHRGALVGGVLNPAGLAAAVPVSFQR